MKKTDTSVLGIHNLIGVRECISQGSTREEESVEEYIEIYCKELAYVIVGVILRAGHQDEDGETFRHKLKLLAVHR